MNAPEELPPVVVVKVPSLGKRAWKFLRSAWVSVIVVITSFAGLATIVFYIHGQSVCQDRLWDTLDARAKITDQSAFLGTQNDEAVYRMFRTWLDSAAETDQAKRQAIAIAALQEFDRTYTKNLTVAARNNQDRLDKQYGRC